MINAAFQNAFPLLIFFGEVLLAQGAQNENRGGPIVVTLHRIMQQPAEPQQTGRSDGGRGGVEQLAAFRRRVKIPGRYAVAVGVGDVIVGTGLGGLEEPRVSAVLVGASESIQSPGEPARPTRIATVALLGGLPKELGGFG